MAKGDRVRITATTEIVSGNGENKMVFVYEPRYQGTTLMENPSDGTCLIDFKGGVVEGSTGFIDGDSIRISKASLKDYDKTQAVGFHGVDITLLIPVFLERYQKRGWFPADNVRIVGGGVITRE